MSSDGPYALHPEPQTHSPTLNWGTTAVDTAGGALIRNFSEHDEETELLSAQTNQITGLGALALGLGSWAAWLASSKSLNPKP